MLGIVVLEIQILSSASKSNVPEVSMLNREGGRKPKKWYSSTIYGRIHLLSTLMAEIAVKNVAEGLGKSKILFAFVSFCLLLCAG